MALSDYYEKKSTEAKGQIYFFYGLEGTGKTYTAMTASFEGKTVVVVDTELRAEKKRQMLFDDKKVEIINSIVLGGFVTNPLSEGIDYKRTLAKLMSVLLEATKDPNKDLVIVIDSMSEVWKHVQLEGKQRLAKAGKVDLDTFSLNQQFDWCTITDMHERIVLLCRLITNTGKDVILTSQAKWIPEYVKKTKDIYATSQKKLPFAVDVVVQFRRDFDSAGNMVGPITAKIEKAGEADVAVQKPFTNPTFKQIKDQVNSIMSDKK